MAEQKSAVDAAVAKLGEYDRLQVTAPVLEGDAGLEPCKFDRLSVERRVLGHITEEVDQTALGPRNTLHALTSALMRDRNTTHPPPGRPRLDADGSVAETAQKVLDYLTALVDAGLVTQRKDGSYSVTAAGRAELRS